MFDTRLVKGVTVVAAIPAAEPEQLPVPPRQLRDRLLSRGEHFVDVSDVMALTNSSEQEATKTMARLRAQGQFFSPAKGFYVAIPPEFATWGVVPAMDFIDAMMTKLHRHYYVALLSAAELHGAAHQRPQVFQVMVDKPVADRDLGRVRLRFSTKKNLEQIPIVKRNSATGVVRVSTPEVTALDLAARPNDSGGLSNVATIVAELAEDHMLKPDELTRAAAYFPAATVRRLGWLLDYVTDYADTSELTAALEGHLAGEPEPKRAVDRLNPAGPRRGRANSRWHIVENADVEPDL